MAPGGVAPTLTRRPKRGWLAVAFAALGVGSPGKNARPMRQMSALWVGLIPEVGLRLGQPEREGERNRLERRNGLYGGWFSGTYEWQD
jgi:hypothetical protein